VIEIPLGYDTSLENFTHCCFVMNAPSNDNRTTVLHDVFESKGIKLDIAPTN